MARSTRSVAVIGSGLAGLTAAYLLRQEGVEVWLIEKSNKLGFHSASVEIPLDVTESKGVTKAGQKWVVDVPMRSFQGGYYPLLIALYHHLGMKLVPTYYTYSFAHLGSQPHFIHTGASGFTLPSLPSRAFASPSAIVRAIRHFLGIALAYVLWVVIAALNWHGVIPRQTTLRHLTSTISHHLTYPLSPFRSVLPRAAALPLPLGGIFTSYVEDIILPLFSAVGTMTTTDVLDSPIGPLLDYVHSTLGTSHFTLAPGSSAATVAGKLSAAVEEQGGGYLRLGEEVSGLEYELGRVRVRARGGDFTVDQVVLATQASAAVALLGMLQKSLKSDMVEGMRVALREVEYRETIVVTHRDWSILPQRMDQREINLCTPIRIPRDVPDETPPLSSTSDASSSPPATPQGSIPYFHPQPDWVYSMGTHIITHPDVEPVLQTTNPVCPIDEDTVLAVARMERALPLRDPTLFTRLHPPNDLIHLAGSYAYPGIPLLEGCVGSAINATRAVLGRPPTGVDWNTGRGGRLGRIWRWRRGVLG